MGACGSLPKEAKVMGFDSLAEYETFVASPDYADCKELGFETRAEYEAYKGSPDYAQCKALGFKTRVEHDAFKAAGFKFTDNPEKVRKKYDDWVVDRLLTLEAAKAASRPPETLFAHEVSAETFEALKQREGAVSRKQLHEVLLCRPDRYESADAIQNGCAEGYLKFIDSEYFISAFEKKKPLECLQEIEAGSPQWIVDDLKAGDIYSMKFQGSYIKPLWDEGTFECNDETNTIVVVISYGWLSRGHPDPNFDHLKVLAFMLKQFRDFWGDEAQLQGGNPSASPKKVQRQNSTGKGKLRWAKKRVVVWMDYCCMYQNTHYNDQGIPAIKRTPDQDKMFGRALKEGVNLLYTHRLVQVWQLSTIPQTAANPTQYANRGWCIFEAHISALVSDLVLDLGKVDVDMLLSGEGPKESKTPVKKRNSRNIKMGIVIFHDHGTSGLTFGETKKDLLFACKAGVAAPSVPAAFAAEIEAGTTVFTNGKTDRPFVIGKYRATMVEVMRYTKSLHWSDRHWGNEELRVLEKAMPLATQLEELDLSFNFQRTSELKKKGEELSIDCPSLRRLNLSYCTNITDVWVDAFIRGAPNLEFIDLSGCKYIVNVGVTLATCCNNLKHARFDSCELLSDASVHALAEHSINVGALEKVDLTRCDGVSSGAVQKLLKSKSFVKR